MLDASLAVTYSFLFIIFNKFTNFQRVPVKILFYVVLHNLNKDRRALQFKCNEVYFKFFSVLSLN